MSSHAANTWPDQSPSITENPYENIPTPAQKAVQLQLVRNTTVKLNYAYTTFLVDPMLAAKAAYPGFTGTARSELRFLEVDVHMLVDKMLKADTVILTHLHDKHWDEATKTVVPRAMPIFTHDETDAAIICKQNFIDVRVLTEAGNDFNGTRIYKTGDQYDID